MSSPSSTQNTGNDTNPRRPTRSLKGRVAIVTGAGSRSTGIGNGRASAILLAESGCAVVCADLNLSWASQTVSMITSEFGVTLDEEGFKSKPRAIAVQADVSSEEDCQRVVRTAVETYGRLDILVNNVGVAGPVGTAVEVSKRDWERGMEVNVTGMVLMAKYAVPAMERNARDDVSGRGTIVNMSSVAGLVGGNPMLLYPTSKGAIVNLTRAMAAHHAGSGIRVNCVCPGMLYTPMLYSGGMSEETREARRKRSILQTEGNGWDAGLAVRFLASDEARWITGVILPVDAGYTAAPHGGAEENKVLTKTLMVSSKL
ncbi:short-chain dehydrogenase/reductase SDR [Coprinopsis cinerea okayama7|uniref:Short-chain dehydrogenase/reductase SDR n=1 Tax=Coprinopsis cinerea (strain Okayama-7 / 130 / ATCC MYA-4618 / FGSC 9003) TaxID=240176 RepID=A8N7Y6_COPC7|nr:short-chain dehydrogenase/reductase SDR [Coprinopsis cinerea okayama7\|eukprot:XP_001830942.2 short-chain dehydrogenase/reductase SDR [Coprinopsis cinerea okayama7\